MGALRDDLDVTQPLVQVRDDAATWIPNEIGVARYRPGSIGITPHLDGKWYRRLVAVITVYGRSRFAICRSRAGDVTADWRPGPGDLVLLRAPGLGGIRDGRPFHFVEGPARGVRCSLGVRMAVGGPSRARLRAAHI